jgi:hypothetical protein
LVALLVAVAGLSGCGDEDGSAARSAESCSGYRFDAAAWRAGTEEDAKGVTEQQRISDDLVRCRVLTGQTKRKVRTMLGPPTTESTARLWVYITGAERGPIKLDPERFQVRFDAGGRVRSARSSAL